MKRDSIDEKIYVMGKAVIDIAIKNAPKLSFEQYSHKISDCIDRVIISSITEKRYSYIDGQCTFSVDKERKLLTSLVELFYLDESGQLIAQKLCYETEFSRFDDNAISNEIDEIIRNGKKIVAVDSPLGGK